MVREFEIINVIIHHTRGLVLIAKHLGTDHDFSIGDGAMLRDLRVYNYKSLQLLYDDAGKPLPDIFVFKPSEMERRFDSTFKEGDKVLLTTSD